MDADAIDLAYQMAMARELDAGDPPLTDLGVGYPTLRKGVVTSTSPLAVDALPATLIGGVGPRVGDPVWMLVDQGRRLVIGTPGKSHGRFVKRGRTSAQSITNNTDTVALFNTTLDSRGPSFWSLPGSGLVRIEEEGLYLLQGSCYWDGNNGGWRRIQVYAPDLRAMQTFEATSGIAIAGHCSTTEWLTPGTDVYCEVRHNFGSSINLNPFQVTFLSVTKLS